MRNHQRSLKEIRLRADVGRVLDELGIEATLRRREYVACCPNRDHDDRKPSWSIRDGGSRNGLHSCFSCHWAGDVFGLVMHVARVEFLDALDLIKRCGGAHLPPGDYNMLFEEWQPGIAGIPPETALIGRDTKCARYLATRGIDMEDAVRCGLRDWRARGRVWVPLHTLDGERVSWLARTYRSRIPKVLTPRGGSRGNRWGLFFVDLGSQIGNIKDNGDRSHIHLTEGWIDAIRLKQAGFSNPVAVCGSQLTEEKVLQLAGAKYVTVWADGDKAGRHMAEDARRWLARSCEVEAIYMPDGTDPADHSLDELRQFYTRAMRRNRR